MKNFKHYHKDTVSNWIATRKGETKLGEQLRFVDAFEELKTVPAQYVIFGIPEDIGVRANRGKPGTATAWEAFLNAFLNIQQNAFNRGENCVLLGEVACENWMEKAAALDANNAGYHAKLGELVAEIDKTVSETVRQIIAAGKTPIVIGGGHNNAYGNIKGTSSALKKPINVLNIDAHTDLRNPDHRHSGNGFSFALRENYLEKYSVFGLHENYTSESIFENMKKNDHLQFRLWESLLGFSTAEKMSALQQSGDFLKKSFGLEIDCDAIENFDSSAKSPSGFSVNEIRFFIRELKKHRPYYLHLCEASAQKNPSIGKALAYFVSDFI